MCFFQIEKKKYYYLIEIACQCSQIVKFNDASVLFYFSSSIFLIFFYGPLSVCINRVSLFH